MGKKSKAQKLKRIQKKRENRRLKRGGCKERTTINIASICSSSEKTVNSDGFKHIKELFLHYNPQDILESLTISNLWLPNISSYVKHSLAFNLLLSTSVDQFNTKNRIDSYIKFKSFLGKLYRLLPSFPSVEDYIPEPDWGEIKVNYEDDIYNFFYGGNVEFITDCIEAFKLKYHGYSHALNDMHIIMQIHDSIISNISKDIIGSVSNIGCGHIETPSKVFWEHCLNTLRKNTILQENCSISSELIIAFGEAQSIESEITLMEKVFTSGQGTPAIFVAIENKLYPVNFREMASVVIDYWDNKDIDIDISQQVLNFIGQRYEEVYPNPIKLINRDSKNLSHDFLTYAIGENQIYLFAILNLEQLYELDEWDAEIAKILSNDNWCFIDEKSLRIIEIANKNKQKPTPDQITLIAIINTNIIPSLPMSIPRNSKSIILLFANFITLFDALKNTDELASFLTYQEQVSSLKIMPVGIIDHFAAFRDSASVLNEGAMNITNWMIDPHWGSNWRYEELSKYWEKVPLHFPDWEKKWQIGNHYDGIIELKSRYGSLIAWSTTINISTVHFVFDFNKSYEIDELNCRTINLFCEHIADALSQRRELIKHLDLFTIKNIVINCEINPQYLATINNSENQPNTKTTPLFSNWSLVANSEELLEVKVLINACLIKESLYKPENALFQASATINFIQEIYSLLEVSFNELKLIEEIQATSSRKPRAMLHYIVSPFDTVNVKPESPITKHYKLARKDLAFILKEKGVTPETKYELKEAKEIINCVATLFREKIHKKIQSLNKKDLLFFAIRNHEALIGEDYRRSTLAKRSLNHEATYNIFDRASQNKSEFIRQSLNHRYLIECILSLPLTKSESKPRLRKEDILQLLADIDWLIVLYHASDTLHNGTDIGGVRVNQDYTPEVFFSDNKNDRESDFMQEQAKMRLEVDININDQINISSLDLIFNNLDKAFLKDLKFRYSHLLSVQSILMEWAYINQKEPDLSYEASYSEIADICIREFDKIIISKEEVINILKFLILDGTKIKKLLGTDKECFDVPISDHVKREHRYTIRPIIAVDKDRVIWGAGEVYKSSCIWQENILNGYLPADFNWPTIKPIIEEIKKNIENKLEEKTLEIIKRFTIYAENIDFKKRFPKEKFGDDGDFDTLAYFPEKNLWLNIECKYNKPAFCLKDTRRQRDTIFGKPHKTDKGQIGKIERRHNFLRANLDYICNLLGWPKLDIKLEPVIINIYVSRDIYWWFRNPPYEVDINFLQVDQLELWLKKLLE